MDDDLKLAVAPLADHPEAIPSLRRLLEAEWPEWYGLGGRGDALADLREFARHEGLPYGLVAFCGGEPCGLAALKAESIASRRHLTPWAGAGVVAPELRRRGLGDRLLAALEAQARAMGFATIYCGTATAGSLLRRRGWRLLEHVRQEGVELELFAKAL